jgi:predicted dehydrogenase
MIAPQEMKYWGPVVSDNNTFAVDQTAGECKFYRKFRYKTYRCYQGSSMIDIAVGHFIASFTYVLGDFESITATTRNNYPTSTVVDADSKPTGQVLPQTADDQGAFNGVLKSGVVASIHCRGGMKMTPGRASLVWLIDGEEGSIRVEGDGYAGSFINIRTPKLYINGEEVELLSPEESFMGNPSRAWEEYAKGDKGDYPTLDDAVRVHCVLDAIYTSAKEGKRVEIKYL